MWVDFYWWESKTSSSTCSCCPPPPRVFLCFITRLIMTNRSLQLALYICTPIARRRPAYKNIVIVTGTGSAGGKHYSLKSTLRAHSLNNVPNVGNVRWIVANQHFKYNYFNTTIPLGIDRKQSSDAQNNYKMCS